MPDPAEEREPEEQAAGGEQSSGADSEKRGSGLKKAKRSGEEPKRQPIAIDDKTAIALYANFCRVTGTPEEVICDFGLNAQPFATPTEPIEIQQRITVNYYTAKRMLNALSMTLNQHESVFGRLETDIQKRVQRAASP